MAVVSVKEQADRRRSSHQGGVTTHNRAFLVTCDDPRDGTAVALTAVGVPRAGDLYRDTVVTSLNCDPVANSHVHFTVEVESTDGNSENSDLHPLDRPADISWGSTETTEDYFTDVGDDEEESKPVANSASDPFEQFSHPRGEWQQADSRRSAVVHRRPTMNRVSRVACKAG